MGGLGALMPKTRITYLIACWAIAGFPWAAGFYSKDEILWKAFANRSTLVPGAIIWFIGLVAATCTSFYMFRSYYLTFEGRAPSAEHKEHVHESPTSITGVLMVLAAASILIGPLLGWPGLFGGAHNPLSLEKWLEPVTNLSDYYLTGPRAWAENHGLELGFMLVSIGVATLGWFAARALYKDVAATEKRLADLRAAYGKIHSLVFDKYRVDELYQRTFVRGFERLADAFSWIDANVVDGLVNLMGTISRGAAWISGAIDTYLVDGAVNGVATLFLEGGRRVRQIQTGRINNYVLGVVVGIIILVVITSLV
jgi:NADH-quinone oxidoreductase subunit L